ncbi:SAV_915 family protein [Streptomyces sp. NPDC050263]|uniref:SAV_915 family protein n=1 Tax=Streptomyces sp. NPDC050263 TaxID=3155037 RepID=UPI00343BD21F
MGTPIRSRLLDYIELDRVEAEPPAGAVQACASAPASVSTPVRAGSRLLDHYAAAAGAEATPYTPPGPRPGVPAYHAPVFVPAHPRYADITDADGRPARVPFIAYELFEHRTGATRTRTVAFAFTTRDRLVAALGEAQPWVATSIGPLAEAVAGYGVTVVLDPRVTPGHHNWQPDDLAALAREAR